MGGVRAANPRVSYADLERWPDDGRRYELYDGEVFVIPSPILLHQIVAGRLAPGLNDYVSEHGGIVLFAPLDIVLTEYDVVQPDLLLFVEERQPSSEPPAGDARAAGPGDRDPVAGHSPERSRAQEAVAGAGTAFASIGWWIPTRSRSR